jgi:hypothetical protein
MKRIILISAFILLYTLFNQVTAQNETLGLNENLVKTFLVEKQNGAKFVGEIVSEDAREILIRTKDRGEIFIPQHEVKRVTEIVPETEKEYITEEIFATRYFITTNGLPIKKGENYIQWNIYGPDFQFGVADNFGVGIMTSWAAIPVIANAKYSIALGKNKSMALGMLAGTGSWALPEFGLLVPFVSFTYGNRRNNITFSTGYGQLFYEEDEYSPISPNIYEKVNKREGRYLLSIAGMTKINEKFSLVFDSFIAPRGPYQTNVVWEDRGRWDDITNTYISDWHKTETRERSPNLALILPGIRWQLDADRAFQFGFTGFYFDNEFQQFAIPMVQWYRRL